ncbi:lipopolysaccharide biosynthesis protein [Pontibacter korlensis]|uniref:Polysaccharide biosynthesis protein n=1 Tax=Pontibacter korlensis TaxID=400092 RepID=A0A0E3ZHY3_9BACT|nr:lipopolysaccharide biosynthesis protein [Pontibacter korlensis]AKD05775.1 polysaccharide biosynthesis protein [Pontibacter korlensis]
MNQEVVSAAPTLKKKENLKQRAYLNSLTNIIDYVVTQFTGFLVSPFIVSGLGNSMYGVWQMLSQMSGYAKVADTRATQVLKWTIAKKKDIVDEEELRSDVTSALAITGLIVPLVLIAGSVVSWYAPIITKVEQEYYTLVRITCSLMILSLVVSKLFDLYESVLRGMNLAFKRMGLRAAIVAFGGGLKVLVLTQGYGLIALAIVQLVITLIIGITYYIVVKKTVSWFGFGRTNFAKIKIFSKVSGWYLADTGASLLLGNSDKILLGFIAGPIAVTYYTLTLFLPTAFQGIINRIVMGVLPGIGKLLGLQEYDKLKNVLENINSITFLLITASAVTITIINSSFLNAWVGGELYAGNIANTLIMVMVIQDTFIRNDAYILSATLDLKDKVLLTLAAGVLFILIGFFLVGKLQITGLCISLLAGKLILFIGQRHLIHSKIQYTSASSILARIRPLLVSLAMLAGAGYITTTMKPLSILEMAGLTPLIFLVAFLVYYFLGLNKNNRSELIRIVSSIKLFKYD